MFQQTRKNQLVAAPSLFGVNQTRKDVSGQSATYSELHADNASADVRKNRAQEMVNQYYDLATDFYECVHAVRIAVHAAMMCTGTMRYTLH